MMSFLWKNENESQKFKILKNDRDKLEGENNNLKTDKGKLEKEKKELIKDKGKLEAEKKN